MRLVGWVVVVVVAGGGCAGDGSPPVMGSHGVPLECPPGVPSETLAPFDRCVLEHYQPCAISVRPTPEEFRLQYQDGRLVREDEDVMGLAASYVYDNGRLGMREQLGTSGVTTFEYEDGRLVGESHVPVPAEYVYTYDGDVLATRELIAPETSVTRYAFDNGRLIEQTTEADGMLVTRLSFRYESNRLVERSRTPTPEIRTYAYDGDRLARVTIGPDEAQLTYSYEGDRLAQVTSAAGPPLEITLRYTCD